MGLHTFTLRVNKYADLTNEEYRQLLATRASLQRPHAVATFTASGNEDLPETVDYRTQKLVTDVKDQGGCGSCWAFSAVASIEGQHAKKTGQLVRLSEQQLVDCSGDEGNQGCNGGLMNLAFDYLLKAGGIESEEDYPYTGSDDECQFDKSKVVAKLTGYVNVTVGDEKALQEATAKVGPISVAIDAGSFWFQFYFGGVYTQSGCGTDMEQLNHGVTVVGYGKEKNQDYWLIKNSWGSGWGDSGYMKLARNAKNLCGVATDASYPLL
jgi:cathepsin L